MADHRLKKKIKLACKKQASWRLHSLLYFLGEADSKISEKKNTEDLRKSVLIYNVPRQRNVNDLLSKKQHMLSSQSLEGFLETLYCRCDYLLSKLPTQCDKPLDPVVMWEGVGLACSGLLKSTL